MPADHFVSVKIEGLQEKFGNLLGNTLPMHTTQQKFVLLLLLLISFHTLMAQRVLYSPSLKGDPVVHFSVAGRAGNNYWVHKEQKKKHIPRDAAEWMKEEEFFNVYNSRLELLNTFPAAAINASTLKKYFICGNQFFDELILSAAPSKTNVRLRRYAEDGSLLLDSIIASFPFTETGNGFILTPSADKTKTLLLGFEPVSGTAPKIHAILFDAQWNKISSHVHEQSFFTQPFIQDDFFCFPSTASNTPVQLANNGEWLMAAPSRSSNNFLLIHFDGQSTHITYKEIMLPPRFRMEDIALTIDNEKREAYAGILSGYRSTAHKNVNVNHYSFSGDAFDFDSSYRFSTMTANDSKDHNLIKESFIAVPDMGFMLLKEYGRAFNGWYKDNYNPSQPVADAELPPSNNNANATNTALTINSNGYSRYSNNVAVTDNYSRGDLSIFYFPGHATDSCWTGFINKKQITELNAPTLSYLLALVENKLVLMYNSIEREDYPSGTTLSLDQQGNQVSERELISWKADQSLIFQRAQQITKHEVAVPYEKNQQIGFAIIRF